MLPRKVIVQLEILTDAKVKDLENHRTWDTDMNNLIPYSIFDITEKPKVNVVKK